MRGMTIIGGNFKRLKVGAVPKGLFVRPMLARMKKSLFDILKTRIAGSAFLDLFAGSGSVGLEALSRGARKVVFIEANPQCQKWIEANLREIAEKGILPQPEAKVHRADVLSGLAWLGDKFDIVFSGAPYKDRNKRPLFFVQSLLRAIEKDGLLKEDGWFIAQHHNKEKFETPPSWDFFRQEHYGDNVFSFFKKHV